MLQAEKTGEQSVAQPLRAAKVAALQQRLARLAQPTPRVTGAQSTSAGNDAEDDDDDDGDIEALSATLLAVQADTEEVDE